jgi:hypothetical protein
MTRAAAEIYARKGIRGNAVCFTGLNRPLINIHEYNTPSGNLIRPPKLMMIEKVY